MARVGKRAISRPNPSSSGSGAHSSFIDHLFYPFRNVSASVRRIGTGWWERKKKKLTKKKKKTNANKTRGFCRLSPGGNNNVFRGARGLVEKSVYAIRVNYIRRKCSPSRSLSVTVRRLRFRNSCAAPTSWTPFLSRPSLIIGSCVPTVVPFTVGRPSVRRGPSSKFSFGRPERFARLFRTDTDTKPVLTRQRAIRARCCVPDEITGRHSWSTLVPSIKSRV